MDFLGWWAFHGRQDEISDEVKMWGKILLVPKSEKKVAENLNLNVLKKYADGEDENECVAHPRSQYPRHRRSVSLTIFRTPQLVDAER